MALVLSAVGLLSQSGCATMGSIGSPRAIPADDEGPSGTSYSYSAGRGIQDFGAAPSAVKPAVYEAMEDLNMTVTRRRRDGAVAQVDGRTPDDRAVTVTVRPRQGMTQVSCRIGWFGDDPLSRTLLERVGVRLGTAPPAAIPDHPPSAPASNPIFSRDAVPDSLMLRDFAEAPYRDRPDL
jgi:Protein of unknown function (DUF3568)